MTPVFLELDEVLALHAESIRRFGGATGIRDLALLDSALATPRATMFEALLHPTLAEQAAAYLFHVVKNHPFLDGNKRTGLAAALVFLGLNDVWVEATQNELVTLTTRVAEGKTPKSEVAEFLRTHARAWEE